MTLLISDTRKQIIIILPDGEAQEFCIEDETISAREYWPKGAFTAEIQTGLLASEYSVWKSLHDRQGSIP